MSTKFLLSVVILVAAAMGGGAGNAFASCESQFIQTADGCTAPKAVSKELTRIVKGVKQADRLQAVIARVDIAGNNFLRRAFGESETGVRATPDMNFRIGSMTIPLLTSAVYQLHDAGRLKLTEPISTWLPGIPRASQVTVRMLMNNTSGYYDWVQGNDTFVSAVYADPFRDWTEAELMTTALNRGFVCDPGTCRSYAHTNYAILARILRVLTPGTSIVSQFRKRFLRPLGIKMAFSRLAPIPEPALAAYTRERGVFEESTGWSPSWGLGNGMLSTTSIDDVSKLARGMFSGRMLSPWSRRDIFKRYAFTGLGPDPTVVYGAQGLVVANGWRRQDPFFNGYMGSMAWFPKGRIAVSLMGTTGLNTPTTVDGNVTADILDGIAAYLTPHNLPTLP